MHDDQAPHAATADTRPTMIQDSLELRILDGIHAGARVPLLPRSRASIGASPECDVVLSDPGIEAVHARLQLGAVDEHWMLTLERDGVVLHASAARNQPVDLGPLRITVAEEDDPWQVDDAIVPAPLAPAEGDALGAVPAQDEAGARPTAPARRRRRPSPLMIAGVGALLMGGVGAFMAVARPAISEPPPLQSPAVAGASTDVARVRAALAAAHLPATLQVKQDSAGGSVVVEGLLKDAATVDAVTTQMSTLAPPPLVRVGTLDQVTAALHDTPDELPAGVTLELADDGAVVLHGVVSRPSAGDDLTARIARQLPAPDIPVRNELRGPRDLADKFLAQARDAGFRIEGHFDEDRLELHGRVPHADIAHWEQWLAEFVHRNGDLLKFEVQVGDLSPTLPSVQQPHLPFVISSVVGGAMPYLVLGDGTRLMPGGEAHGYRLAAINAESLVFDTGDRSVNVTR